METYVCLINGTGKPNATDAARTAIERAGCKEVATYVLMGQYDVLLIIKAPDSLHAAAAIWAAKQVAGAADTRTQTMRAFDTEEMARLGEIASQSG